LLGKINSKNKITQYNKKMNCNGFNQYYTDIVDSNGKMVSCFDGGIYSKAIGLNVNSYKNYQSKGYYTWINENFKDYSFPLENYDSEDYSPENAFSMNCESKTYSLKQQQKFAGRIFNTSTDINSMLIYHGLGSGKTQTSIVIGEAFKLRKIDNTLIPGRTDSRILIVVPAALQQQYYSEIIGKYESGIIKSAPGEIWISGDRQYYSSKSVRSALLNNYNNITRLLKEKASEKEASRLVNLQSQIDELITLNKDLQIDENTRVTKIYEIITHESFLNRLFKIEDSRYIEQPYLEWLKKPNGLLIIDEIQNLISATGTNYRRLLYALKYYANPQFRSVFLTGTPIYDKPYEFGLLINLLRPRVVFPDGRDSFNEVFLKDNKFINQEYFKKMCSGYISYFNGGNPIAYPYKKTTIMYHQMEDYQYSVYKEALVKEVKKDQKIKLIEEEFFINKQEDRVSSGIFNNSNQFCNIAYPKVSITRGDKTVLEQNIAEFKKVLSAELKANSQSSMENKTKIILKTVRSFSSKFAKVAEMISNCEGSVFVFSNYVYYGVDAMGIIMDHIGYKAFPQAGPKGSYFVWKGEINSKHPDLVKNAKKAFNDPKNIDGSVLKVMFGTQTVMEGVEFKNVNQVHVLDPWWNDSRVQQVIARAIRFCSHKDLPIDKRTVDVFIHLSTLGSFEKVFDLKITDSTGNEKKVKSFLQIENRGEPNSSKWVFYEAYSRMDQENNVSIQNSKNIFYGSQIVPGSIIRGADQGLTKEFGPWKQLDSRSVQEYMYTRSLEKLSINRQFEKAIKETAVDCTLNKNGNVIRLQEMYTPNIQIDNTWNLVYENYSTGEKFIRLNVKSMFNPKLPENVFTLEDILSGTAKNSNKMLFKNVVTGEEIRINKSLIVTENIDCKQIDYSFKFPEIIVNLTLNKELIPLMMKMDKFKILEFFNNVQFNQTFRKENISDSMLPKKLKQFMSKKVSLERQKYIDALKEFGFSGDDELWDAYTLEQLKMEYNQIN